MALFGRSLRFLIALVFFGLGYAVAQFANGNGESITVSIAPYTFRAPVFLLALIPLAAGLLLGWLYTVPARTAEFADHWRQWRAIRQMDKENKQLRKSLDTVLDLPGSEAPAPPAPLETSPVGVHEGTAASTPTANGNRRSRRPGAPKPAVQENVKPGVEAEPPKAEPKAAPRRRARRATTSAPAANPA